MTAATAFWAGIATGLTAAVILTNAIHRAFAWMAHRIDHHIHNAIGDDDPEFRRLVAHIDDDAA